MERNSGVTFRCVAVQIVGMERGRQSAGVGIVIAEMIGTLFYRIPIVIKQDGRQDRFAERIELRDETSVVDRDNIRNPNRVTFST